MGSHLQTTLPPLLLLLLSPGLSGSSVVGKAGSTVELTCSLSPSSAPYVVEWVRQGLDIPVLINYVPYPPHIHPHYEGRVSLVGSTCLRLSPLKLEDQGLYECRVLSLEGAPGEQHNGSWTRLSVTAPPTLTKAPPPVTEVMVGRALSLSCVANGNPAPVVTWFKEEEVIQTGGQLSLRSVSAPSAGLYTCMASNSEGNASRSTRVQVKGPPVIVTPPKSTVLNISQNALLQCRAIADPPNMTYVWLKGDENVHHIDFLQSRVKIMVDGTLLISRLLPEDSGKYTCSPTNGILAPPTASATLTVLHPAQASQLPQQLFLPTGREGVVSCPAVASPPLLRVEWSKDGEPVDLAQYPGWTLTAEGSVVMATVNDDVGGVYTCTPYNSYGTMGASGPITVKLQDPPWFVAVPSPRYNEEVGRTLLLPCQANKEPTVKLSWSKMDVSRRVSYSVSVNGSLLLQPLTKEHQGLWECRAENRVASVSTTTQVYVLGTSPHAATALSVTPGVTEANVSWVPGFDGGSEQSFSVWVKRMGSNPGSQVQDWFSLSVPLSSGSSISVSPLSPNTVYQFSVLSQNRHGTGPFSEILTAQTLDAGGIKPASPLPPSSLWASRDAVVGIVLRWTPPPDQAPPLSAFILQARCEEEEDWAMVGEEISANLSETVVPGLHKDSVFQLRLMSRRGELLSEPSPSITVSTVGMDMYPSTSRLLEFGPEPLLAGVLGGVAFMCLALVVLLAVACLISHKRERHLLDRRRHDPPPSVFKPSPSQETSGHGSPDSLLKKSLLPSTDPYPSLSSGSSCSAFSTRNQTRPQSFSNHHSFSRSTHSHGIEIISRGPDGRFTAPDYDASSIGSQKSSVSLHFDCNDGQEPAYVLSVDLPPVQSSPYDHLYPAIQVEKPTYNLYSTIQTQKTSHYEALPDFSSLCSNSSLATVPFPSPSFPVLPHIRTQKAVTSTTTASTLVLQMEHEREKGNLSRCLKLAQEREELERQLRMYTKDDADDYFDSDLDSVWQCRSKTLPHKSSSRCAFSSVYPADGNVTHCSSLSPSCFEKERHASFGVGLTLPHQSTQRQTHVEGYRQYNYNSTALTQPDEPGYKLGNERCSMSSLQSENRPTRCHSVIGVLPVLPTAPNKDVEMCVDEPELVKPPLHQRIHASLPMQRKEQPHTIRRSKSLNSRSPVSNTRPMNTVKIQESKHRSHSLDSQWRRANSFLTPDAWINSLSQDNFSVAEASQPNSLVLEEQQQCIRDRARSPKNSLQMLRTQSPHDRAPADRGSSRQRTPNPHPSRQREPRRDASATHRGFHHEAMNAGGGFNHEAMKAAGRYLEAVKRPFLEEDRTLGEFEEEADGYRYCTVVRESGSYSSYASSGIGSMDPPNTRLSPSHMTNTPRESPHNMEKRESTSGRTAHRSQRKVSVDENYEWDSVEVCSQLGDGEGLLPPLPLQKPLLSCAPPRTQHKSALDHAHFSPAPEHSSHAPEHRSHDHTEGAVLF